MVQEFFRPRPRLIAGLELGSKQITLGVGEVDETGRTVLQRVESVPSVGVHKGTITDAIECADTVARLVRQVEQSLTIRIASVWVALPGQELMANNATASVPITDPNTGVTKKLVDRSIEECQRLAVEYDRQILHALERGFVVDGQSGIRNPIGLSGSKLGVELHIVSALNTATQNTMRVLNRAGLEMEGIVLPALAASGVVLADLDKDLGVTLANIGDYTSEVVVFSDNYPRETFIIDNGIEHIKERLSRSFQIPKVLVEQLLSQVTSLESKPEHEGKTLEVKSGSMRQTFALDEVTQLLNQEVTQLLKDLQKPLGTSPLFLESSSGVVLVGLLPRLEGVIEMSENIFNTPVRLGMPRGIEIDEDIKLRSHHTTAVGLVYWGLNKKSTIYKPWILPPWLQGLNRFKQVIQEYF